jgi:hypothetical protein
MISLFFWEKQKKEEGAKKICRVMEISSRGRDKANFDESLLQIQIFNFR